MPPPHLPDLISALLESTITPAQHACLADLLRTDPAARDAYHDAIELHGLLRWQHGEPAAQFAPPARPASAGRTNPRRIPTAAWAVSSLAAALLLAAAIAIYVFVYSEHRTSPIEDHPSSPPIATLIESTGDGALTTPGDLAVEGSEYGPGEYALSAGTAEFMLTNSVNVKLRGETRMWMRDEMNVALNRGSATFLCPSGAKGFTVHLPDGSKVVDLGTRFTVTIDPSGQASVAVIEGAVAWERDGAAPIHLAQGDSARASRDPAQPTFVVRAGATSQTSTALSTTNGDFESGANDTARQDVPDWFDHPENFSTWVNAGSLNENGSENLSFGSRGDGYAYQSLGTYNAIDGQTLYWRFEQVRFSNKNASARMNIRIYAGPFTAATDGTDIEGHASEPTELLSLTFDSLNEDELLSRVNSGALDLSDQPDGTEIWLRIGWAGSDDAGPGGAPVDNVWVSQTAPIAKTTKPNGDPTPRGTGAEANESKPPSSR